MWLTRGRVPAAHHYPSFTGSVGSRVCGQSRSRVGLTSSFREKGEDQQGQRMQADRPHNSEFCHKKPKLPTKEDIIVMNWAFPFFFLAFIALNIFVCSLPFPPFPLLHSPGSPMLPIYSRDLNWAFFLLDLTSSLHVPFKVSANWAR